MDIALIALFIFGTLTLAGCSGDDSGPFSANDGWKHEKGFAFKPLEVPSQGKTGFTSLSPEETGVTFVNTLKEFLSEDFSRRRLPLKPSNSRL